MSKSVPESSETAISSDLDVPQMHSSIDLEAHARGALTVPNEKTIDQFESIDHILKQLRRRIGQLYVRTGHDDAVSRISVILITLEACVARLDQEENSIRRLPSLAAIIHEIDQWCMMIERGSKRENTDAESIWSPLVRLLENQESSQKNLRVHIDHHLASLEQRIDKNQFVGNEQLARLTDQLATLRESQLSENRKFVASLGALHATIERCVDRLSRVEYGLMEARSIETSSAIAEWPHSMQSVNLSGSEDEESTARSINPRNALAAARGAFRSTAGDTDQKNVQ